MNHVSLTLFLLPKGLAIYLQSEYHALPGPDKSYDMYTRCPKCKQLIGLDEFEPGKRCRHCGADFTSFDRKVLTLLSVSLLGVFCLFSWWFVYRKGGWSKVEPSEQHTITTILISLTIYFGTWLLWDWFYRAILCREKNPSHLFALIAMALTAIAFSKSDTPAVKALSAVRPHLDWGAYVLALLVFCVIVGMWTQTLRFYGRISWRRPLEMARLGLKTRQGFFLVGGALCPFAALGAKWFPDHLPPLPSGLLVFLVVLGLLLVSRYTLPPAVLLLSSSSPDTVVLALHASNAVLPLRLVHLLDPHLPTTVLEADQFHGDSLRTIRDASWQNVVHPLTEWVPIVVIDTRIATPAVVHETARMLESGRRERALFIVGPDGHGEALTKAAQGKPHRAVTTVTQDELPRVLKTAIRSRVRAARAQTGK